MTTPRALDLPVTDQEAREAGPRRDMAMVLVLLIATFMGQFDFFVVNVAAPTLRRTSRSATSRSRWSWAAMPSRTPPA